MDCAVLARFDSYRNITPHVTLYRHESPRLASLRGYAPDGWREQNMNTRDRSTTIRFHASFHLPGAERSLPEGEYHVVHNEVRCVSDAGAVWRRVGSIVHVPAIGTRGPSGRLPVISAGDLDAALEQDRRRA
jgi:hypothetical protein